MGLKTKNYEVKKLGITLPEAYAVIKELRINGKYGRAIFAVQTSREACLEKEPIETVELNTFEIDRNESPYVTAYKKMTEGETHEIEKPETGEKEIVKSGMPFYGWENDLS